MHSHLPPELLEAMSGGGWFFYQHPSERYIQAYRTDPEEHNQLQYTKRVYYEADVPVWPAMITLWQAILEVHNA